MSELALATLENAVKSESILDITPSVSNENVPRMRRSSADRTKSDWNHSFSEYNREDSISQSEYVLAETTDDHKITTVKETLETAATEDQATSIEYPAVISTDQITTIFTASNSLLLPLTDSCSATIKVEKNDNSDNLFPFSPSEQLLGPITARTTNSENESRECTPSESELDSPKLVSKTLEHKNQTLEGTLEISKSIESFTPSVGISFDSKCDSISVNEPLERLERGSQKASFSSGLDSLKVYEVGVKLVVVKPYRAQDLDEIDLDMGDVLEIEETPIDDFWIKGIISNSNRRNNGQRGYFPKEHTDFYDPEKGLLSDIPIPENESVSASLESPTSFLQPVPTGTVVIAMYPYEPTKQDELQFAAGVFIIVTDCPDGGWWKGSTVSKNPSSGWFPANLVKLAEEKKIEPVKDVQLDETTENFSHQKQVSWFKRLRNGETITTPETSSLPSSVKRGRSLTNTVHSSVHSSADSLASLAPKTFEIKSVGYPEDYTHTRASVTILKESHGGVSIQEDSSLLSKGRGSVASRVHISGVLSQAEIMQGATEEKIQDKISPSIMKFLTEQERKRFSVVWELVQTERDYVRDLTIIVEIFMKPMANMLGLKNMQTLFANVEQILAVNTDFLVQLIQIEDIRNITAFAEIFLTMGERFMCYIPYCSNQQSSSAKFLKSLLTKGEVKTFLDETHRNTVVRQLDLPGFLLKPVQRICKYPLLLKELIKNTPTEHSDLVVLNRAIERMQNAVSTINECAKRLNGMKPVLEVQNRFSEKINIANANRFLVREDVIQVLFSNGKKSRKLFLFNDLLILTRKDWRDKHHVIEKTSIKDIRVCDISETSGTAIATPLMELEILPSSEFDMPNRYIISATSLSDKQYWLDAYKSLVRYHVKSKNITDITMTSSSADGGDDDDISKEPTEANKKAAIDAAAESQKKPLLQRIELLEKVVLEKENSIKDWEAKVKESEVTYKQREDAMNTHVQELTAKLLNSEMALANALDDRMRSDSETEKKFQSLLSDLQKEVKENSTLNSEILGFQTVLKEKAEIIDQDSSVIHDMTLRIQNIALVLGIRFPKNKSFSSLQQLRPSVAHNLSSRESNIGLNQIDKTIELLASCENGIEDLLLQLSEKNEQISFLKKDFTEKECLLSNTLSSCQKKLAESDQIQVEYSNQLIALKKDKILLEASAEEQKTIYRKSNVEYENTLFEIRAKMKREVDKSIAVNDQLEELTKTLQSKDALLKQTTQQLEQATIRLQSTQGDINEKDTAAKQLMDRSSSMKETLDEIQLALEKAKSECPVDNTCSGGLLAQIKSFLFLINSTLQSKNNEIQDIQLVNLKLKEKLGEKKQEIVEVNMELDTAKSILNQLKASKTELEGKLLSQTASIQALSAENEGLAKKVKEKLLLISDMEATAFSAVLAKGEANKSTLLKYEQIQAHFDVSTTESEKQLKKLQSDKFHLSVEIDDLKHALSRLKEELQETHAKLEASNQQKDNRAIDFENSKSELIAKIHEFESAVSNLTAKVTSKVLRIEECELEISSRTKQVNQLQSIIEETEIKNSTLKNKIGELENEHASANLNLLKLEQKLDDAKQSYEHISDILKTSERERKDYLQDIGKLLHENSNFTREVRILRDQISELSGVVQKLESKLLSSQRESDFVLSTAEDRHKQALLKVRTELEQELASCKHAHSKELTELNIQINHQKLTFDELSKQHLVEVEALHLRQNSIVQQLKLELSNTGDQLSKYEKALLTKDFMCKTLEREGIKLKTTNEKFDDEIEKYKSKLQKLEESHTIRQKEILGLLDEKSRLLQKKEAEFENLNESLVEKNIRLENLTSFSKENEARLLSENGSLKGKKHDIEIQYHESLLLIERMKAGEDSSKGTIEAIVAELEALKKSLSAQTAISNELALYKSNAIVQSQIYLEMIEKKDKEIADLRDCVKRVQKEGKKALKIEIESFRTEIVNTHNRLREEASLSHEAEVEKLSSAILQAEEECRHEKFLNYQLEAKISIYKQQVDSLEIRKRGLENNLEETITKINTLEIEYNHLKQEHTLQLAQFVNTKDQLSISLTEGLKVKDDMNSLSSIIDQLQQENEMKQASIFALETLQKSNLKSSKTLAAYHLALTEISKILKFPMPKKFEQSLIISLVSTLRQAFDEKEIEAAQLRECKTSVADLTSKNNQNQELIALAKREAERLESKLVENEALYSRSIEALKGNTLKLQERLQGMTNEYEVYKRQYISVSENLTRLLAQKASLEKDYITVYEKMQEMKESFQKRSRSISSDNAALIDQINHNANELNELREKNYAMSEKIKQLVLERHILLDQKANCDSILASTKSTVCQLLVKKERLIEENSLLQTKNSNIEKELRNQSAKKNTEIEDLRLEISRAQERIASMSKASKDANALLEEFQLKVLSLHKREKELEKANNTLSKELSSEREKLALVEREPQRDQNAKIVVPFTMDLSFLD